MAAHAAVRCACPSIPVMQHDCFNAHDITYFLNTRSRKTGACCTVADIGADAGSALRLRLHRHPQTASTRLTSLRSCKVSVSPTGFLAFRAVLFGLVDLINVAHVRHAMWHMQHVQRSVSPMGSAAQDCTSPGTHLVCLKSLETRVEY